MINLSISLASLFAFDGGIVDMWTAMNSIKWVWQ